MKKSIIALAVAGAMAAPIVAQADATLYGTVAIDYVDVSTANSGKGVFTLDDTIIGVKSSHELDGGLTSGAEIKVETGDGALSTTLANAYLSGDFGTAIAGKISNPINDVSADIGTSDSQNYAHNGATSAAEIIAAAYMTPDMGGFSAYAGVVASAADPDEKTVDAYMLGAKFGIAGLSAHLGYVKAQENGATAASSVTGLKLGYSADALSLGAVVTDEDHETAEVDSWGLTAGYDLGATDLFGFYTNDDYKATDVKAKTLGVKATYALGTGTKTYAEWSKTKNVGGVDNEDATAVTVGYAVSF